MDNSAHIPVLLEDTLRMLDPQAGESYFDGTAGYGGHARRVIEKVGPKGQVILVDRDQRAVKHLAGEFSSQTNVKVLNEDYFSAAAKLVRQNNAFDMVLLDLGVSSPQLDTSERGFSFKEDGPLDMRMDENAPKTAADLVNGLKEKELADLIYKYGEDRKSRRIASAIVKSRPIATTAKLADVVAAAVGRNEDIHPATRTFQALRIAVNEELEQVANALPLLVQLLNPGGRIAVISFHSLEDRLVKEFFRREARDCICPPKQPICTCGHIASLKLLNRKPIAGTQDAFNPRARSAKLRAAVKLTPKQGDESDFSHPKSVPARKAH